MAENENKAVSYGTVKALAQLTKDELDEISGKITAVRKNGGSYVFEELPEPSAETLGLVYDVADNFTTDERFREGAGIECPAGTNVEVAEKKGGGGYEFDLLAGNMSGYVKKDGGKVLSDNNFSDDDKEKLDGITDGATKVAVSETNGHISINGKDTPVIEFVDEAAAKAELEAIFNS